MNRQVFTNQLHPSEAEQAPTNLIDPSEEFLQIGSPTLFRKSTRNDEEQERLPQPKSQLTEHQLYTLRSQISAYKHLIKNIVSEDLLQNSLSNQIWEVEKRALLEKSIADRVNKIDRENELRAMVMTKMPIKSDETPQDRAAIDQAKFYVDRRRSEIDAILQKQDLGQSLRMKLLTEQKFLSLRDTYLRIKEKIVEGLAKERRSNRSFEQKLLDRNYFRREKPPRNRDSDYRSERNDSFLKNDGDRQRHARHKEIMQNMYVHHCDFFEFHKKNAKMLKKRALLAKSAFDAIIKKREDEENEAQKIRLQALKKNDMESYMKLVKDTKNQKIQELLEQTNKYLKELGAKVLEQKGEKPDENEDLQIKKQDEGILNANKIYYNLTHTVNEKIIQQPTMLTGGILKHYQLVGLEWLVSLYNNNLNGILADEMGLGKTIQTISLFAYLIECKKNYGPFLIVVPLSTLANWISQFDKWAPTIKKIIYRFNQSDKVQISKQLKTTKWNVCITTYQYILKDRLKLNKFDWKYIVIDQGHRMKNAKCKFVSVLGQDYTSSHRLLLTGTPLQNSLGELWSLLNFLLPKVFNDCDDFEKWFLLPISKSMGNENVSLTEEEKLLIINRLHQVLRPFLLRRVKKEVESELPDKREQIIKVELSSWQRIIYNNISKKGALDFNPSNSKIGNKAIINLMMQLRKCCNHPYMFLQSYQDLINEYIFRSSGKFELLDRILPKLIMFKHRILIFSQMTSLMDIMQSYFNYRGIRHLRLDGNTKAQDRGQITNLFNKPESPYDVFLLSTRAGGLGLNLQTADTVIIFDSDWNPQMDKQAQDRAHRIGQKKQVLVIRLITNTVIEEGILQRAEEKMNLDQIFIQGGLYNLKSSDAERKQKLEDLFKKKKKDDDIGEPEEIPDDEMINKYISRDEGEFETFNKMDQERYQTDAVSGKYPYFTDPRYSENPVNYRLMSDNEVPDWLIETSKPEEQKQYGRGNRVRKQVNYNDDLIDLQIDEFQRSTN